MQTTEITSPPAGTTGHRPDPASVVRAIEKRSFATLATSSSAGRPHAAGVLYEAVDEHLWINSLRTSRKARNIALNPHVAMVVPVRRVPVGGPPSTVHFQAIAELFTVDAPEVQHLIERGALASLTGHGELDLPDGCFIRVELPKRLVTYGLGMSLLELIRDPLAAGGIVER